MLPSTAFGPTSMRGGASGSRLPTLIRPLLDAARDGDLAKAKELISSGHDMNEKDHGGWTPFIRACEYGHLDIAKLLAQSGANIKDDSAFHWTALMKASEGGHLEVVKWLIDQGMDVEECNNSDKETALWLAVSKGHAAVCEYLVKKGANLNHVNKEKTPMLIQACYKGRLEVVKFLIAQGVDAVKTVDVSYSNSAFMTACAWGHTELVEWLVKNVKGINLHEINPYGSHAMSGAMTTNNIALAKLLVSLGWKLPKGAQSPIIGVEDLDLMKYFVEDLKYPVNVATQYGTTAIGHAAYNGKLAIVQYLISHGADPFAKSSDGTDALDTAMMAKGKPEVDAVINYLQSLKK